MVRRGVQLRQLDRMLLWVQADVADRDGRTHRGGFPLMNETEHGEINAAIDLYARTTLYSRDTLQRLAMNHPDVGEFRFIVGRTT